MRGTKEKEKRRKEKACVLRGGGRGEREIEGGRERKRGEEVGVGSSLADTAISYYCHHHYY